MGCLFVVNTRLAFAVTMTVEHMQDTRGSQSRSQPVGTVPTQNGITSRIWTNFANKTSLRLGVTQIVIGVLCIICEVVVIVDSDLTGIMGQGIWGGLIVSDL